MKLLIDADILIHKAANKSIISMSDTFDGDNVILVEDLSLAKTKFIGLLDEIRSAFQFDETQGEDIELFLAVTVGRSFRYDVCKEYKGNRPVRMNIIGDIKKWLIEEMNAVYHEGIEADDILGMHQDPKGSTVICTEDKDLLQIPGRHYNWRTKEFFTVTEDEGLRYFYKQILSGDDSDNYKGCPSIGLVKSKRIIDSVKDPGMLWEIVCLTFVSCGSTYDEALRMARTAYILHPNDEPDYRWEPPQKKNERIKPNE